MYYANYIIGFGRLPLRRTLLQGVHGRSTMNTAGHCLDSLIELDTCAGSCIVEAISTAEVFIAPGFFLGAR
jgi:hypothetical protein